MIGKPTTGEYAPYFDRYILLVDDGNIFENFDEVVDEVSELIDDLSDEKMHFRYAEDKWSILEIIGHIADTYLVFSYRALRFARNDEKSLLGYDHDFFVKKAFHDEFTREQIKDYFESTAEMFYSLFKTIRKEDLKNIGDVEGNKLSVGSIIYIMTGHTKHHLNVIKDRYLD